MSGAKAEVWFAIRSVKEVIREDIGFHVVVVVMAVDGRKGEDFPR